MYNYRISNIVQLLKNIVQTTAFSIKYIILPLSISIFVFGYDCVNRKIYVFLLETSRCGIILRR